MEFVQAFNINGVCVKQTPCIELKGKPNAATEGRVGLFAIDVTSPLREVYKCVAVNGSIYTWELLTGGNVNILEHNADESAHENTIRNAIKEELAKNLQVTPEFVQTKEEMTDTSKLYLYEGNIWAWMYTEKVVGGYTNLLETAVGDDHTTPYNGTGYKNTTRLNSSATAETYSGVFLTGFIPIKAGGTIYLNGNYIKADGAGVPSSYIAYYYSGFNRLTRGGSAMTLGKLEAFTTSGYVESYETNAEGYVTQFTLKPSSWDYPDDWGSVAYMRLSLLGTGDGCIIANTPIVAGDIVKDYAWTNTGYAFVPTDYEPRILELEYGVNELNKATLKNTNNITGLNERVADIEAGKASSVPDYWQEAIAEAKAKIANKQALGGVNCANFLWTTDIHASAGLDAVGTRLGLVAKAIMDESDIPLFVSTGDLMSQSSYTDTANIYEELALVRKWLSPIPYNQQALIMGNHDGAWGNTTAIDDTYKNQLPLEVMYNLIYRKQAMDLRRVSGDNGTYYYIDNVSQKMRYIMLNTNNTPSYAENDDKTAVYNRFDGGCYCQEQLQWVIDVALDMPEGYTACIFGHEPYPRDWTLMVGIVDAYNNKGTYSNTYTDEEEWRNSTVKVDFTNAKGKIAGVFAGHVHDDMMRYTGNNPMYSTCPLITMNTSLGGNDRNLLDPNDKTSFRYPRTDGTDTEFAMDIVTVDTKNRKIYMTRLGAGIDREVSY